MPAGKKKAAPPRPGGRFFPSPRRRFSFALYLMHLGRLLYFGLRGRPAIPHYWSYYLAWFSWKFNPTIHG
ncbi:hypothetical protein VSS95_28740, partial [Pseudomonas syringae pv. tagetis]